MKLNLSMLNYNNSEFLHYLLKNRQVLINGDVATVLHYSLPDINNNLITSINTFEVGQYGFIKNRYGDNDFNIQRYSFHEKIFTSINAEIKFYLNNPSLFGDQDSGRDEDIFYMEEFLRNLILKKE